MLNKNYGYIIQNTNEINNEINTAKTSGNGVKSVPTMLSLPNFLKLSQINTSPPTVWPPAINVQVLLHGNGTTNGTLFLDNSYSPAIFTPHGNITTQPNPDTGSAYNQFSVSSIYTPSQGYLSAPIDNRYRLGTGSFTLEAFIYFPNPSPGNGFGVWFDTRESGGGSGLFVGFGTGPVVRTLVGVVPNWFDGVTTVSQSLWNHIAIVRYDTIDLITNTNCAIYLNGVRDLRFLSTADLTDGNVHVGQDVEGNNNFAINGYLNEIRLTKGIAVYSGSSFTPPIAPLADANP